MATPNFTTETRQLAYENLLWLVKRHHITSAVFKREKAKLVARQNKSDALAEKKYQERLQKQKEKRESKAFIKKIVKDVATKKSVSYSILDVDNKVGFANFVKTIVEQGKNLLITIGNISWVVNQYTQSKLMRLIDDEISSAELHEESWGAFVLYYKDFGKMITISEWQNTNTYDQPKGAFFKHYHNTSLDLKKYGIYALGEKQDHSNTCLVNALACAGLPSEKLEHIKNVVVNRVIPQCKIGSICDIIKAKIILKKYDPKNNHNKIVYGKQYETEYHIGLIEEHYIFVEPTTIVTRYALENYQEVCTIKDFHRIYRKENGSYKKTNDRFLDSFDIIKVLMEQKDKLLKEMSVSDQYIASTQFYDKVSDVIGDLNYDASTCKLVEQKTPKEDVKYENIVFDFECGFQKEADDSLTHLPYVVCIHSEKYNKTFYGYDCGIQMLAYLGSLNINVRLIAHNATYDYRFLIHHLRDITELSRGNRLISLKGTFGATQKPMKVEIKDSYHLISMPLKAFPKVFGLADCKEVMPYNLYTKENIDKRFMNIDFVLTNFISADDKQHFLENLKKWKLIKNDEYDILEYSAKYCQIDCKILWEGYNIFRKWQMECVNIDIDNKLTIASLAHSYMVNQGCYEGVYELNGVPQMFIQKAVVGGRTMVANNSKICIAEKVNDFDAVSLYPSAMARMDGFLKGLPKVITNTDYDWLKTQDGFFVEIEITGVGIRRAFPLMSFKNDDGIRMFTNEMMGKRIIVDKVTLEDLIEFQKISFNVIRGYYFNEGLNTKVNETIKYLFEARLQKKKEKNPAEMIYKLIMNSGYGKSIMKAVETESKFFDNEDSYKVYVSRNYNSCTTITKFGEKFKVKIVKPLVDHKNICQVGTMILAWSKRIMNEVMCLAEDTGLDIFYQDTDSLHIKDCDIKVLVDAFKVKYGRELVGKSMGQFHSDFDIKGCNNIIARRSIFLGKKSYIDELEGVDANGNVVVDYHTRMKGIPNSCLEFAVKQMGLKNMFELYEKLWNGASIKIDLTNSGEKANFKFMPDYKCKTLSHFERTIKF
jgi:hypothetical protein